MSLLIRARLIFGLKDKALIDLGENPRECDMAYRIFCAWY